MLYMVTFTINIPSMLAYIPYMDPMGNIYIYNYCSFKNILRFYRAWVFFAHVKRARAPSPIFSISTGFPWSKDISKVDNILESPNVRIS